MIEVIKDYTKFISHNEQRPIMPAHVRKLAASMRNNGFLKARAITCILESGRLLVLDGHHRLEAAKTLGIPVQVFIAPKALPLEVLNTLTRNWSLTDCINSYIIRGNQEYFKLNSYISKGLPTGMAIALLSGHNFKNQNNNTNVRNGTFKVATTTVSDAILDFMFDVGNLFPQVRATNFLSALAMSMRVPEFKLKTLAAKIHKAPDLMRPATTKEAYLDMIDRAYNHQAHEKIPLAFLAKAEVKKSDPIKRRKSA